ncbi:TPA: hypothetical protein ACH3X2_005093 [Trebouxia sp. C0005]
MVATSKLMNGKQVRGRNEGLEPVFRSEGQVSNAESTSRQPGHHYLKLLRTGRAVLISGVKMFRQGIRKQVSRNPQWASRKQQHDSSCH